MRGTCNILSTPLLLRPWSLPSSWLSSWRASLGRVLSWWEKLPWSGTWCGPVSDLPRWPPHPGDVGDTLYASSPPPPPPPTHREYYVLTRPLSNAAVQGNRGPLIAMAPVEGRETLLAQSDCSSCRRCQVLRLHTRSPLPYLIRGPVTIVGPYFLGLCQQKGRR